MATVPPDAGPTAAWRILGGTAAVMAAVERWREPWRRYHDRRHLGELLEHLRAAEDDGVAIADGPAAIAFAVWHDAVYDPQAAHGRNERLSADLCRLQAEPLIGAASAGRAVSAILATIDHRTPDAGTCPDAALLLDCDLAILGAPPERFARYEADVREEYAHVADRDYHAARGAVMARFAARPRIYATDWAHARWDHDARRNLARYV